MFPVDSTIALLAAAVVGGFAFLVAVSVAILDELDALGIIAKGNYESADISQSKVPKAR